MADLETGYKELEFPDGVSSPLLSVTYNNDANHSVSFTDITNYKNKSDPLCVYINADLINLTNTEINSLASRYSAWIPSYTPLDTNLVNAEFSVKKFVMTDIGSDEVTLTDVTSYAQIGSVYNADKINSANIILMNLQSSYNQNVNGTNGIMDFLHANGAKSNDLLTAFKEMEEYQHDKAGFEEGIRQVQANPSGNNCYTPAQLASLTNSNTALKNLFASVKTEITRYISTFTSNADYASSTVTRLSNDINTIQGGMPRSTAYSSADSIKQNSDQFLAFCTSIVQEYSNKCTNWANNLN